MDHRLISAAVELVASDLRRSLDFYRLLGLTIADTDSPHVEVELPGGNRLLFDTEQTIASFHPGWTSPTSPGRLVLAFGLPAPADVDGVFSRVTDAGHPAVVQPFDAPWGQRYATVADPDGTSVDLYAPLPT
jgi:catechol 2,3-dioxygenase-like lactoylglutathione lyase family enzyme